MEITEVRVVLRNDEKLKAYATITLDNCFVVRRLRIIQSARGLFVAMPAKRRKDGTFKDVTLERPGLWNGAMAHWNTIFAEVPIEVFNPVKTVNDLLRPEHQSPTAER